MILLWFQDLVDHDDAMLTSADLVDEDDDDDDDENDEKKDEALSNEKPVNPERLKAFNVCLKIHLFIYHFSTI